MNKKFYSVSEVVEIIGNISKGNVYRLIKKEKYRQCILDSVLLFLVLGWRASSQRQMHGNKKMLLRVRYNGSPRVGRGFHLL